MSWPVVNRQPVVLAPLAALQLDLWHTVLDLAEAMPQRWTLIGGQMVLLHALEHGAAPTRVSTDLDALVNVRAVAHSIPTFVDALTAMGFVEDGISPENLAHRYRRKRLTVDVLAPEGLGLRVDLRTAPPSPGRTLQVPAGTQALDRTELVPIVAGDREGLVPRPSLLGAIIAKAEAVNVDDLPEAQLQDVALLLTLVDDPFELELQLTVKDLQRLRKRRELTERDHNAWRTLAADDADRGHATLAILLRPNARTEM